MTPDCARRTALLAATCGVAALNGCAGYTASPAYDPGVRTVAVPIFKNQTFDTGLEARLTEAVIKEIQRTTRWRVVDTGQAATTLHGTITDSNLAKLSRERDTGLAMEQGVRLTVDFDWVDNRSGDALVSRRSYSSLATFVPHRPVAEPIETGQDSLVRELASGIVSELRSEW